MAGQKGKDMAEQERREFRRRELADLLERLAKEVRRGAVELEGHHLMVPEVMEARMEVKAKKGRVTAKLALRWPAAALYEQSAPPEVRAELESFKELKKRLGASFSALLKAAQGGGLPPEPQVAQFQELSRAFARVAEPDWAAEMQEYLDHVANLVLALKNQQAEMFQHELRDLKARMQACHREFA